MQATFENPEIKVCPFCLQPISFEHKTSLVQSIKNILSKIVDEHKTALLALKIPAIEIDLSPFQKLRKAYIENCETALLELNNAIKELNEAIDAKIENPYSPIELKQISLRNKGLMLKTSLEQLEDERIEYNKPLNDIPLLQKILNNFNYSLAYYEIKEYYDSYHKQSKKKDEIEAVSSEKLSAKMAKKKELDELLAQRKNIKIAIKMINERLRYVFFSAGRLEIESDDSGTVYTLKSNGINVKPSNISVGERNILALCYFFVEMLNNTNAENAFSREALIVIDDPISSFDHENRIGIMSLLRRDLENVIIGNEKSKVVVLTHDLQSVFDMQKAFDEINKKFNIKFKICELKNRKLEKFQYNKRHEYTKLLTDIYYFGVKPSEDYEPTIGNIMRRTLEAFSTFLYKKGFNELSMSDEILNTINNKQYVAYFRHLMFRLVLNGESHTEERVRTLTDDNDFLEMYSIDIKQKTAKDIICFIYLLNPEHVRAHLGSSDIVGFEDKIKCWCKEILSFTR